MMPGSTHGSSLASISSSIFSFPDENKSFVDRTLNFRTSAGRYFLLCLLLTAGFVPAIILLSQNIVNVLSALSNLNTEYQIQKYIQDSMSIQVLIHEMQLERGYSTLFISSNRDERTRDDMLYQRLRVDGQLVSLPAWPSYISSWSGDLPSKLDMQLKLILFRHNIDTSYENETAVIRFYSEDIDMFMAWMTDILTSITSGNFWTSILAFQSLSLSKENAGLERARGAVFFSKGYITLAQLTDYMDSLVAGQRNLLLASEFSSYVFNRVHSNEIRQLQDVLDSYRSLIFTNGTADVAERERGSVVMAQQWIANMTQYINSLHDVQNELSGSIRAQTESLIELQNTTYTYSSILMVLEFFFYPILVVLTLRLVNSIKAHSKTLSTRMKGLYREQRRNATLVKEMYPPSVATKLLKGQNVDPECFESATVCFSALADFEELSRDSHGVDIIFFINRLFELMDDEIIKYDVFKVETVGDQYMVVSGIPLRNGNAHVKEIADMTLGLLEQTASLVVDHLPTHPIQLTFGMCSGPVCAGIVGLKMPRYCLFGDTVNMASRMQSSSQAFKVHMSKSSADMLVSDGNYDVIPRGQIEVKGKGWVDTYWLGAKYS